MSTISAPLLVALLAMAGGAGPASAVTDDDGAPGGRGGTATAVAGDDPGDVATATPGNPGADGTEVGTGCLLPVAAPPDCVLVLPYDVDADQLSLVNYVASEPEEQQHQSPNAHVDHSGADGRNVTIVGSGDEEVRAVGADGANGAGRAQLPPEVANLSTIGDDPFALLDQSDGEESDAQEQADQTDAEQPAQQRPDAQEQADQADAEQPAQAQDQR